MHLLSLEAVVAAAVMCICILLVASANFAKSEEVTVPVFCTNKNTPSDSCSKGLIRIDASLKRLDNANFFNAKEITDIDFTGSQLEAIGNDAFGINKLESVVIPDSVKSIGDRAFSYNKLQSVNMGSAVTVIYDSSFSHNMIANLDLRSVITIGEKAFAINNIVDLVIPSSVTFIGFGAFAYNKIPVLVVPASVKHIGEDAFKGNPLVYACYKGSRSWYPRTKAMGISVGFEECNDERLASVIASLEAGQQPQVEAASEL